jgi:hypothetical protein
VEISLLSNVAVLALFAGMIPSISSLVKNRRCMDSFSTVGSIATIAGQVLYLAYFAMVGDWITVALSLPMLAFWVAVLVFKFETGKKPGKNNGAENDVKEL